VANPTMDPIAFIRKHLEEAEPDLLRELLQAVVEALMGVEVDALAGAAYRERSDARTNRRNGTARGAGTRARARSIWRSPSFALARTSRIGCWSRAGARSARCSARSPRRTSRASRPAGRGSGPNPRGERHQQVAGLRDRGGA
jgi:hypothetical protein